MDANIAEQSLIGCVILNSAKVMPEAASKLTTDDFYLSDCKTIFGICKKLFEQSKPIDIITILHEIQDNPADYKVHLAELAQSAVTTGHYQEYIQIVAENSRRTKAIEKCMSLQEELTSGCSLDKCQALAADIAQTTSTAKGNTVTALEGFNLVANNLNTKRTYINTGFKNIDRYVLFNKGDYIIVAGRPSTGKTALTLQMVLNMAQKYNTCYFSLETSAQKIYERLIACFTNTPFDEINRGEVKQQNKVLTAKEKFTALKLEVVNAAGWTVQQIKAKAIQARAEIILIDYIGLIKGTGKTLYEQITGISQDLHIMAQQGNIAVVALSQLNRAGAGEPDMTSIRESGQIEQDADAILLLNIPGEKGKKQTNERELIIAKNKTGKIGKLKLSFNGNFQRFIEIYEEGACRPF